MPPLKRKSTVAIFQCCPYLPGVTTTTLKSSTPAVTLVTTQSSGGEQSAVTTAGDGSGSQTAGKAWTGT